MVELKKKKPLILLLVVVLSSISICFVLSYGRTGDSISENVHSPVRLYRGDLTKRGFESVISALGEDGIVVLVKEGELFASSSAERIRILSFLASRGLPSIEDTVAFETLSLQQFQTPGWAWGDGLESSQQRADLVFQEIRDVLLKIGNVRKVEITLDTAHDDFSPTETKEVVRIEMVVESPSEKLKEGVESLVLLNTKMDLLPSNIKIVLKPR